MIIEEITVTAFQQHTRILGCEQTKRAMCIDPGDDSKTIIEAIDKHRAWSRDSGDHVERRRAAARSEVAVLLQEALLRELEGRVGESRLDAAVARVADREIDPYAAVEELLRK